MEHLSDQQAAFSFAVDALGQLLWQLDEVEVRAKVLRPSPGNGKPIGRQLLGFLRTTQIQ